MELAQDFDPLVLAEQGVYRREGEHLHRVLIF
jgi:hypothetical protein